MEKKQFLKNLSVTTMALALMPITYITPPKKIVSDPSLFIKEFIKQTEYINKMNLIIDDFLTHAITLDKAKKEVRLAQQILN